EGPGEEREGNDGPAEVIDGQNHPPGRVRKSREYLTHRKVEKVELNKWRSISKELYIPINHPLCNTEMGTLQPCASYPYDNTENNANHRYPEGHSHPLEKHVPIISIVENGKIDAVCLI